MLSRLAHTAETIRRSRATTARAVNLPESLQPGKRQLLDSITRIDSLLQRERITSVSVAQSAFRRFVQERSRRKTSRQVVSKMRWLEDLIVRSAGTGPASDGARDRLKELDGDTQFFNVLQAQAKIVGLGPQVRGLLTRLYEAIDQAYPRQEQKDAVSLERLRIEEASAFEHQRASIGI